LTGPQSYICYYVLKRRKQIINPDHFGKTTGENKENAFMIDEIKSKMLDNYNERLKNYGEDMTIKESTNKTDSFAHNIGVQLWQMTNAAHSIASDDNVSDELAMAAETALQSLLKSMAIYGYNLVDGDK